MPPKAARPQAPRPQAARPKASRASAARPEATRPKASRAKASRPKAAGPKAARPKPSRPPATRAIAASTRAAGARAGRPKAAAAQPAPSTAQAAGALQVKCKHVYRKRDGWEVRCKGRACDEYGGWFKDHGAAVLRACELYGLSEDQLRDPGPAAKASRRERTCERTIYKGILKVGSQRYQVQPFGTYLGVRETLEDALQLALAHHAHISREDLMRDGAPGVAAQAARSLSSVSSLGSAGARTAGAGSAESPPDAAAALSPRIRKRLRPTSASNGCQEAAPISDLSAEQFRVFFGCLWAVYGQPDEEFLPADLSDMVARLRGRRRVRARRCGRAASLHAYVGGRNLRCTSHVGDPLTMCCTPAPAPAGPFAEHYHTLAPALYFCSVGLKFGPARDALEAAAAEVDLLRVSTEAGRIHSNSDAPMVLMELRAFGDGDTEGACSSGSNQLQPWGKSPGRGHSATPVPRVARNRGPPGQQRGALQAVGRVLRFFFGVGNSRSLELSGLVLAYAR